MGKLDLNADLGEGVGDDAAMLAIVTSASIACGGHAGDEATMRAAIRSAKAHGVTIGAHPGFVDPDHFGRRRLDLPHDVIAGQMVEQVARLIAVAAEEGSSVAYVKIHGALANMAAEDRALAVAIFSAVKEEFPQLAVLALEASEQEKAALELSMAVIAEAYADRAYQGPGRLLSRSVAGSVLHDSEEIVRRCLRLAERGEIVAAGGKPFHSNARSLCLHGDTPGAVAIAADIRKSLEQAGFLDGFS
ncbi:5-oxoprolinase subunit PxpA [Pelagibacterium lentulum]|uniref:UPF0271 protein n=1 Tax=Pelagibacterium lentulum TaxID=2029865 RepID=A0A916REB4_9HYPH|nr:5-oxoprolinase subunit PxpA [Pelagibacterium lentulum]GGA52900.1 UPF0271 protein [Pelagibacterium lentulum]